MLRKRAKSTKIHQNINKKRSGGFGGRQPPERGHPSLPFQAAKCHLSLELWAGVADWSKVIFGVYFGNYLHLTNKGDSGILEIIIVTSDLVPGHHCTWLDCIRSSSCNYHCDSCSKRAADHGDSRDG